MAVSSITVQSAQQSGSTVKVTYTVFGLFPGSGEVSGFVELFSPTSFGGQPVASSEFSHFQSQSQVTYTDSVDISGLADGTYTARVSWNDMEGNSGSDSTSVTIQQDDTPGGGTDPGEDPDELTVEVVSCGLQGGNTASPGDRPVFEAQIQNLSATTVDLPVTLFVNGEAPFGERMEPNIEPGETRTFLSDPVLPEEGTYNYELEVGEPVPA